MRSSNIGGQAVIEGVMMRYRQDVAVAVRKPDGEIEVGKTRFKSVTKKNKILGLPIIRGVVAFIESLVMGIRTLTYSASFYDDEEENNTSGGDKTLDKGFKSKGEAAVMGITVAISLVIAAALFIVLPYVISSVITKHSNIGSSAVLALIEGVIKLLIFLGYLFAISRMKDIRRTFMYHGAEHKCINCIETGHDLTVPNVMKASKEHKRCGTSFIFIVLFVSIIFFIFIRVDEFWLRLLIRILLIPVIAGISYEIIQWAGRTDSKFADMISRPGLWFQGLTTKEPTADMAEVAIASVEAVFDWKAYLTGEFGRVYEENDSSSEGLNEGETGRIENAQSTADENTAGERETGQHETGRIENAQNAVDLNGSGKTEDIQNAEI